MADKAYSSAANRAYLRKRRIQAVMPVKEDQKKHRRNRGRAGGRPPGFDAGRYKERNTVLPVQLVRTVNQAALMVRRRSAIPVTGLPSQFCPAFFRDWLAGAGAFVRAIAASAIASSRSMTAVRRSAHCQLQEPARGPGHHQPPAVPGHPVPGRPDKSRASASPTETPQLRDTAPDPHRNPTDETAHSGTLVMRVKGTENSRSAASMRVSWAVGAFSR